MCLDHEVTDPWTKMFDEPSLIFVFCFLFPPSLPLSSVIRCIIQECVRICTQNSFEIESTAPFSEEISKYKFCKSCIILTLNETARDCLKKKNDAMFSCTSSCYHLRLGFCPQRTTALEILANLGHG